MMNVVIDVDMDYDDLPEQELSHITVNSVMQEESSNSDLSGYREEASEVLVRIRRASNNSRAKAARMRRDKLKKELLKAKEEAQTAVKQSICDFLG
jgi:hypothetical protein